MIILIEVRCNYLDVHGNLWFYTLNHWNKKIHLDMIRKYFFIKCNIFPKEFFFSLTNYQVGNFRNLKNSFFLAQTCLNRKFSVDINNVLNFEIWFQMSQIPIHLSIYLFTNLSIHLSIYLSISLSTYMSIIYRYPSI